MQYTTMHNCTHDYSAPNSSLLLFELVLFVLSLLHHRQQTPGKKADMTRLERMYEEGKQQQLKRNQAANNVAHDPALE